MPVVARSDPDAEIYYDVIDFGPPWQRRTPILLHHGVALSTAFWYGWLPILAAAYPVILLDMRGHGRSSEPAPDYPWSIPALAADALAVLDAAGYERCHFVGESVGGTIGLQCAATASDRVASLTAISTAYRGDRVRTLEAWEDAFESEGAAGWSRMMMSRRFNLKAVDPQLAAWYEAEQAKVSRQTVMGIVRALRATDLTDHLPGIAAPTLLLSPEDSPFVSTDLMAEAQALIPRSELAYFRGAHHGLINSHPEACARAVVDFIGRRVSE